MSVQEKDSQGESGSLFKDVCEKKQNLRRIASEVGVMAAELQKVRSRAVAREAALQEEAAKRQAAEAHARELARQLEQMHKSREDTRSQAQSSATLIEQYAVEIAELRDRLSVSEEVAEAMTGSAHSAQLQVEALLKEIEEKNLELQEQRNLIVILEEQLRELQVELKRKESSQKQLRFEVQDLETQIEMSLGRSYVSKECEFRKLLNEVSSRNIEHLERYLLAKDDEIGRLKQDVKVASTELRLKTLELDAQLERQQRADQELRKKVVKLELSLQEARLQAKKLKKVSERKDKEIQNLRAQVWLQEAANDSSKRGHFWNNFRLPTVLSMSALALVCLVRH
ncbi:hypothetical protein Mapa_013212 [Marchantia paleacea]|nr:hypothetical protein Mapa_013212 [Marchantia paleacea]